MAESILIVDDEDIIRESLSFILTKEGYAVQEAPNGRAALEIVKEDSIDLVLTNLEMPEIKGIELLRTRLAGQPGNSRRHHHRLRLHRHRDRCPAAGGG